MPEAKWFEYTDGIFGLALVDKEAVGYSESWMAPSGLTADQVSLETYDMPNETSWYCQVTSGKLTPKSATRTRNRPATMCTPASTTATPVLASWSLDVEWAQDPHVAQGLSRFLFEHDAEEAYFVIGLNASNPPLAIGRVYLVPGEFGGALGSDLLTKASMLLPMRPSVRFGDASSSEVVD